MRWRVALVLVATACSSKSSEPRPAPGSAGSSSPPTAPPADATRAAFERIDPKLAEGSHYITTPKHPDDVGTFFCKLEARFGKADLHVNFYSKDPPTLGWPLLHTASRTIIVPLPTHIGFAGDAKLDANGQPYSDPEWRLEPPEFKQAATELIALLATTTPVDCEYTFSGPYRVTRAGVRNGKSFAEPADYAGTLDARLAQFAYNDEHGGDRKPYVERDVCASAIQNWGEGKPDDYPQRDVMLARLVRCLETAIESLESDVANKHYDADAAPEEAAQLQRDYKTLGLTNPDFASRIKKLIAAVRKRG